MVVFNTAITKRGTAQRIVRELKEINPNVLGAILIGVRLLKGGYFGELFESYREYQNSHAEHLAERQVHRRVARVLRLGADLLPRWDDGPPLRLERVK